MSSSEDISKLFTQTGIMPGTLVGQNAVSKTYLDAQLAAQDARNDAQDVAIEAKTLVDGMVTTPKLAPLAVTADKVANEAIELRHLTPGLITIETLVGANAKFAEIDEQLADTALNVKYPFGTGLIAAIGDGITDDTAAIQAIINYVASRGGGTVLFPNGTYRCANIQLKTGVNLIGVGSSSILKLLDNATSQSHNGSTADSNGVFAGNILGTTLTHSGGTWFDNGVRALNPNNSTYIVENALIINLKLDGNRANNTVGDTGQNASSMGACIGLHQAKNITIQNCILINARMDGIHVGYALHGGSDYCKIIDNYFENNTRTGIAQTSGKYNFISGNTIRHTGTGEGIDVEGNIDNEINMNHIIVDNPLIEKGLSIVSPNQPYQRNIKVSGNFIKGGLKAYFEGHVITNNTFMGDGTGDAIFTQARNLDASTEFSETVIEGNIFDNFNTIIPQYLQGGPSFVTIRGNKFTNIKSGFWLTRAYKITIEDNEVYFAGGDNTKSAIVREYNQINVVLRQGKVTVSNNKFYGSGLLNIISQSLGTNIPTLLNDCFTFKDNVLDVSHTGITFDMQYTGIFKDNTIKKFNRFTVGLLNPNNMIITNNIFEAASSITSFDTIEAAPKKWVFKDNILKYVVVRFYRPQYFEISNNSFVNGALTLSYANTSVGVGGNLVNNNVFNKHDNTYTTDYAFIINGPVGFNAADFTKPDQYANNTHIGFYGTNTVFIGAAVVYTQRNNSFTFA